MRDAYREERKKHPFTILQVMCNDVSMHTLARDTSPKYAMQHQTLAHDAISLTHPYNKALCIACTIDVHHISGMFTVNISLDAQLQQLQSGTKVFLILQICY